MHKELSCRCTFTELDRPTPQGAGARLPHHGGESESDILPNASSAFRTGLRGIHLGTHSVFAPRRYCCLQYAFSLPDRSNSGLRVPQRDHLVGDNLTFSYFETQRRPFVSQKPQINSELGESHDESAFTMDKVSLVTNFSIPGGLLSTCPFAIRHVHNAPGEPDGFPP